MSVFPRDLDRALVREILADARHLSTLASRIEAISRRFVGDPYREGALVGSKSSREIFTASLEAFDCVTYVENVLALTWASNPRTFIERLRRIRYAGGVIDWEYRNHYMTTWIRNNAREGLVHDRTGRVGSVGRSRRLDVVDGIPARTVRVRSIPKRAFLRRSNDVRDGDLAFFGSTRPNLDVFHCGILFHRGDRIIMRHAARSRGQVVEQDLVGFLGANRMTGVILVRPEACARKVA